MPKRRADQHEHRHHRSKDRRMFSSVTPHPVTPADGSQLSGFARIWHQLGPGSRTRHARARVESEWLAALRYQWQQACQHVGLGYTIYTPSGHTVSVPRIARADFGPPVSCTVRLRPGQRAAADITPRRSWPMRSASAGLTVTNREAGWVNIGKGREWSGPDVSPVACRSLRSSGAGGAGRAAQPPGRAVADQLEMLIVEWIFITGSVTELASSACSPAT
jgi:hypothetical protein